MMPESYLKYLISTCNKFARRHDIFDIVLYGSSVKGEEGRDIDILLVFSNKNLEERTETSQKLKETLKEKIKKIDMRTINLDELFDSSFLARQGIFIEGYSLLHKYPFSKRLGFVGHALFHYNLKKLSHNEKTKFIYALSGRKTEGLIKKIKAEHLGKGVVLVPIEKSKVFENFLQQWKITYKNKNLLVSSL